MGIITIQGVQIFEVTLGNASVERLGIQQKMVNRGSLILPQLRRCVLAQGVDKAVCVEHRRWPFLGGDA